MYKYILLNSLGTSSSIVIIIGYTGFAYRMSQEERSIFWEVIVSAILSKKCTCTHVRTVSEIELFHCTVTVHCTDEQHAMSSYELQSALMLTVEFSKVYYARGTVPTLSLEQQIPVLEPVRDSPFFSTILELYSEIALSETVRNRAHVHVHSFA
jgi:hypothetical protein